MEEKDLDKELNNAEKELNKLKVEGSEKIKDAILKINNPLIPDSMRDKLKGMLNNINKNSTNKDALDNLESDLIKMRQNIK